jgi:hypothetical protein
MGFFNTAGGGVACIFVGPVEGQMVLEGPVSTWMPSSVGGQKFGGNDEYNVHTHYI